MDGSRLEEDSLKFAPSNGFVLASGPELMMRDRTVLPGTIPPHFYGELVKTPEGCQVLEEQGHFLDFADHIRDHGLEHQDLEGLWRLKSVLWAVVSGLKAR